MGNTEVRNQAGQLHNENGPAVIIRSGLFRQVTEEKWYINGKLHREGGPAHIFYYEPTANRFFSESRAEKRCTFKVKQSSWYKHGELHNENGPAFLEEIVDMNEMVYSPFFTQPYNSCITFSQPIKLLEEYYQNGELYNPNGPIIEGYRSVHDYYHTMNYKKIYHNEQSEPAVIDLDEIKAEAPHEIKNCCSVCLSNTKQIMFIPCGHVDACANCSKQLVECHICRQPIENKRRAYIT